MMLIVLPVPLMLARTFVLCPAGTRQPRASSLARCAHYMVLVAGFLLHVTIDNGYLGVLPPGSSFVVAWFRRRSA